MLFQMTDMIPSSFAQRGLDVVDCEKPIEISCTINGNSPVIAWEYIICKNTTANEQVYTTGKKTLPIPHPPKNFDGTNNPFIQTLPSPAGMINGNTSGYNGRWKLWYTAADFIEQASASPFSTRSAPTFSINPFPNPLKDKKITITANYTQAQNVPLEWFRFIIANNSEKSNIVFDTGLIYGANEIKAFYDELFTDVIYNVKAFAETQDGVKIESEWIPINVKYDVDLIEGVLEAKQSPDSSSNTLNWSKVQGIFGTPNNDHYSYLNNIPVMGHNSILMEQDNTITYDKVMGDPMEFEENLNYIWSGTIEKVNSNILEVRGKNQKSELSYHESAGERGFLCELKGGLGQAQILGDTSIVVGTPLNNDYKVIDHMPVGTQNTSLQIDGGNSVIFDRVDGNPMSIAGDLAYAYSGKIDKNNMDIFEINGRNINGNLHAVKSNYNQVQEPQSGIYCGAITNKLQDFKFNIVKGVSAIPNDGYTYLENTPIGSNQKSICINADNSITFDTVNNEPMHILDTKSFVWSGKIQTNNSNVFTLQTVDNVGNPHTLRFYYNETLQSKSWVSELGIYLDSIQLFNKSYAESGNFNKSPILNNAWVNLIITETAVILKWQNIERDDTIRKSISNMASSISRLTKITLLGGQTCSYIWALNERISDFTINSILNDAKFFPSKNYDNKTTLSCEFNGDKFLTVANLSLYSNTTIREGLALYPTTELFPSDNLYPKDGLTTKTETLANLWLGTFNDVEINADSDIMLKGWLKIVWDMEKMYISWFRDSMVMIPFQKFLQVYPAPFTKFGSLTGLKLNEGQTVDYIAAYYFLNERNRNNMLDNLSYEPNIDNSSAFLCKFGGESSARYGFIEYKHNNILMSNVTLVADSRHLPFDRLLSEGWWTMIITPQKLIANWYKNIVKFASDTQVHLHKPPSFKTTSIKLFGNQKCDYLWIMNNNFSAENISSISADNLLFEPSYIVGTQMLAKFDESLGAGNVYTEFDIITGVLIQRVDLKDNSVHNIIERDLTNVNAVDFGGKSRQSYQYYAYAIGNKSFGAPITSDIIQPHYWNWCLLDCVEAEKDKLYTVEKEYLFRYNIESGALTSNSINESVSNFTGFNTYMVGTQCFVSGSLSGLMGSFDCLTNTYNNRLDDIDELMGLITKQSVKFIKDRAGNLWKVQLIGQMTFKAMDETFEQPYNFSLNWEQCGLTENISIVGK